MLEKKKQLRKDLNVNTTAQRSKSTHRFVTFVMLALAMLFSSVLMAPGALANDEAAADAQLQTYVYSEMAGNQYGLEGGGYLTGQDLMELQEGGTVTLVDYNFSQLDKKAQNQFGSDLMRHMDEAADESNPHKEATTPLVTQQTTTNWLKDLQSTPGIGSKLLIEILSNTKPDFVKANEIYAPFSGLVGTAIGLITVITMAALVLSFAIDIAYIVLPFFRENANAGEGSAGKVSKLVSSPARASVSEAEGKGEGGDSKEPMWLYIKKRFIGVLFLAIALLLLVSGEVFNAVGTIIDMGIGFVGSIW